ncbi:zinc finger protein ZAT1-like protein [Tanacetum coccineum]
MLLDENEKYSIEQKIVEGLARQKKEGVDKRLSEMIDISFALTIDVQVILSRQRRKKSIRGEATIRSEKTIRSERTLKSEKNRSEVKRPFEEQQKAAANACIDLDDASSIQSRTFGWVKVVGRRFSQSSRDLGKNKSRKTFKCAVCFKEFGSGSALGGHMRAHYRKCLVCSKEFESGEDLEDHKRANSCVKKGTTGYKCSICYREFGLGKALGGHKRVHSNVVTKQQGSYTLDLLQEIQAGRSFSGSYESPSDTSSGAQEIPLQHENKFKIVS